MYRLGHADTARTFLESFAVAHPANPNVCAFAARLMAAERQWDSAQILYRAARVERRGNPMLEQAVVTALADLAAVQSRYGESRTLEREAQRLAHEARLPFALSLPPPEVRDLQDQAIQALFIDGDRERAVRLLEDYVRRAPPSRLSRDQRSDLELAELFARGNRVVRARELLGRWEAEVATARQREDPPAAWHDTMGMIALTEGRFADALDARRRAREKSATCGSCNLVDFAEIHDRAGRPDSAIAYYESWINTKDWERLESDRRFLWLVRRRLGELYEARGDTAHAVTYYRDLLEQWKAADAMVRPIVRDIRDRTIRLAGRAAELPYDLREVPRLPRP